MVRASPKSWRASEVMAVLPDKIPPTNSNSEKNRLRIKGINRFFIMPP
jgi:hypothetical protein